MVLCYCRCYCRRCRCSWYRKTWSLRYIYFAKPTIYEYTKMNRKKKTFLFTLNVLQRIIFHTNFSTTRFYFRLFENFLIFTLAPHSIGNGKKNGLKWYKHLSWSEIWIALFGQFDSKSGVANRRRLFAFFFNHFLSLIYISAYSLKHAYNFSYFQTDNKREIKILNAQ